MLSTLDTFPLTLAVNGAVTLRRFAMEDGAELHDIVKQEEERLKPWIGFAKNFKRNEADAMCAIAEYQSDCGSGADYWITTQQSIKQGHIKVRRDAGSQSSWTAAYWIRGVATGEHLAGRALQTLSQYLFAVLDASDIHLEINKENESSRGVARFVGATIMPDGDFGHFETWRLQHA